MKKLIVLLLYVFAGYSCDKDNNIDRPVELRFSNLTGSTVDSVFFNVGLEVHDYKVDNLDDNAVTDYIKFDNAYSNVASTIHIGTQIFNHPRIDLVCCLTEGKYTVNIEIVRDSNNEEISSTSVTED
jgi:hypothetical protein